MALAVSQAVKIEASSGTAVTVNNAITFTSGALAVALVSCFQGTGSNFAASDSINGSYTMRTAQDVGNAAVRFGDKPGITSGLANLTADGGTGASGVVGIWHEVTGAATSSAFDTENGATGSSAAPDTVNVANAQADSIYFAAMANEEAAASITYTINQTGTEGTFIEKSSTQSRELDGNTYPACGVVYQIVSSISARSHTWGTQAINFAAASAIYKMASAGGPAPFVGQITGNSVTGYRYPISARTHLNPMELQLIGQDKFFGAAGEVHPFDWPLPKPYPHPISARTHLNAVRQHLIGKDQFFTTPGDAPSFSWPLPQPYPHPISARTWLNALYLEAGKDVFFGAPGFVLEYAWPLPMAYAFPLSGRTWLMNLLETTLGGVVVADPSASWIQIGWGPAFFSAGRRL